jgi:hypothetical protein
MIATINPINADKTQDKKIPIAPKVTSKNGRNNFTILKIPDFNRTYFDERYAINTLSMRE